MPVYPSSKDTAQELLNTASAMTPEQAAAFVEAIGAGGSMDAGAIAAAIATDPAAAKAALDSDDLPEALLWSMWGGGTFDTNQKAAIETSQVQSYPASDEAIPLPNGCKKFTLSGTTTNPMIPRPGLLCLHYSVQGESSYVTQESVDYVLTTLDTNGLSNGYVDLSGCPAPSATGLASKASLEAKGWMVVVSVGTPEQNGYVVLPDDGTPLELVSSLFFARGETSGPSPTGTRIVWSDGFGGWMDLQILYPSTVEWPVTEISVISATLFEGQTWIKYIG